jgi:hypothetical protein
MGPTKWLASMSLFVAVSAFGEPRAWSTVYPTGSAGTSAGGAGGSASTGAGGASEDGGGVTPVSSGGCSIGGGRKASVVAIGTASIILFGLRRRRLERLHPRPSRR